MNQLLIAFCFLSSAHSLYDSLKSEVQVLTAANWMSQVKKGRSNDNIIIVHFHRKNDGKSAEFAKEYTKKAEEYKGVFVLGHVDCDSQAKLCQSEGAKNLPLVKLYPPQPLPVEDQPLDIKKVIGRASQFLKSYVTEINGENITGFVNTEQTLPKVLFFTENQGVPLIVKALSKQFNKKLAFGIVRKETTDVVKQYNVKKFPSIYVLKSNQKKPNIYDKEMNYRSIFDFLNFFSEQFATVDNDKTGETKPWLFDAVPELTDKSAADVCLSIEKVLCVILFSPEKPTKDQQEVFKRLKAEFENKLDKVAAYKFMWINSVKNEKWSHELGVTDVNKPVVRILNPGRRKRFVAVEGDFTYQNVESTLEKISGGDARFVQLKGDIPPFTSEL